MKASKKKRGFVGALALASVFAIGGYALTNTIAWQETYLVGANGTQDVRVLQVNDTDFVADDAGDRSKFDRVVFTLATSFVNGNDDAITHVKFNGAATDPTGGWIACDTIAAGATVTTIGCDSADTLFSVVGDGDGDNDQDGDDEIQLVVSE